MKNSSFRWWKGREPSFFSPCNVKVGKGCLQITMKQENLEHLPEGFNTYTSGAVKSKKSIVSACRPGLPE